ncbi:MAG: hypothetical protein U5Q03_01065 [Bacteroidota bacterium]|nr:hypothetical protein [Bacteroidota bacterium]
MKKRIIPFILLFMNACTILSQSNSITIHNNTIEGRKQGVGWIFENETDSIIALPKATYETLLKKYRLMEAELERNESIIQAKDELIAAFENYEDKADAHILVQDSLVTMADTLYKGYKDLYRDLKKIMGIRTFSLSIGGGLHRLKSQDPAFLLDAGVEYNMMQMSYQLGKDYNGVVFRYRVPLF